MSRNDMHQAVRNVIYNELGITKEEIRQQIQNEIRESIERLVERTIQGAPHNYNLYIQDHIRRRIDKIINNSANYFGLQTFENAVKHHLANYVAKIIMEQLDLSVKTKEAAHE